MRFDPEWLVENKIALSSESENNLHATLRH